MPFPTTVRTSRTLKKPPVAVDTLVERLADELRRAGVAGVSTGHAVVQFDAGMAAGTASSGSQLMGRGEVEVIDHGQEIELVAEADVSRLPLTFGTATLVATTMAGGLHAISLTGGLLGGALIALVPWWIARQRLAACLKRVAREAERGETA